MTMIENHLPRHDLDALQNRFALRVASRLNEASADLPADVETRLRFAREQALARAMAARAPAASAAPATSLLAAGRAAVLGSGGVPRWMKLASFMPLVVLLVGLSLIQQWHQSNQVSAAAEIDAELLSDAVPPDAYSDAGFVEFLKAPHD
jgi:type II secretory pathway component PulL